MTRCTLYAYHSSNSSDGSSNSGSNNSDNSNSNSSDYGGPCKSMTISYSFFWLIFFFFGFCVYCIFWLTFFWGGFVFFFVSPAHP